MTNLARVKQFKTQSEVVQEALAFFSKKMNERDFALIEKNARATLSDPHLFEVFEMWNANELSDKAFVQQLREYASTEKQLSLSEENRDLTNKQDEVARIKAVTDKDFASRFAKIIQVLAASRGLATNEKLAAFLEMNEEQVRVLCKGEHKPQRKTLIKVAMKFKIPLEVFLGQLTIDQLVCADDAIVKPTRLKTSNGWLKTSSRVLHHHRAGDKVPDVFVALVEKNPDKTKSETRYPAADSFTKYDFAGGEVFSVR